MDRKSLYEQSKITIDIVEFFPPEDSTIQTATS